MEQELGGESCQFVQQSGDIALNPVPSPSIPPQPCPALLCPALQNKELSSQLNSEFLSLPAFVLTYS